MNERVVEDFLLAQPDWARGGICSNDALFILEELQRTNAACIGEIGVASGLSGTLMIQILKELERPFKYFGIDNSVNFYLDSSFRTGQLILDRNDISSKDISLLFGDSAARVMPSVTDKLDFLFIDGNHRHPWATFDLLSLIPVLKEGSRILLHDVELCLERDQGFSNRGPKYLYDAWNAEKYKNAQERKTIAALEYKDFNFHIKELINLLYIPFEDRIPEKEVELLVKSLPGYASEIQRAFELGNYFYQRMHASEARNESHLGLGKFISFIRSPKNLHRKSRLG